MMRIITGTARGTKLATPEGENTRPTAERVKEAVFSMLQFELEGRTVLDLFAGSGQLALEALSRGAEKATLIDDNREATAIIMDNAKRTHLFDRCRISTVDWCTFLRGAAGRETYHIVFLDPPYAKGLMPQILAKLWESEILSPGAAVVCETDNENAPRLPRRRFSKEEIAAADMELALADVFGGDETLATHYAVDRTATYGRSRITVLRPNKEA